MKLVPENSLKKRLKGLIEGLNSVHEASTELTNATKGSEREAIINTVLRSVIAPPFRIGSGDIIDHLGNRSGQLDIVIEHGGGISFPLIAHETPRLYLAESVCAVVEVKSNLNSQWGEVLNTADKLASIKRLSIRKPRKDAGNPFDSIPLLVVGYNGWKKMETLKEKLNDSVTGIFSLDPPMFAHSPYFHGNHSGSHELALYGFLLCLESATSDLFVQKPPFAKYKTLL